MSKIMSKRNLSATRKQKVQVVQQQLAIEGMTTVEAIERVVALAKGSKLSDMFFWKVSPYLQIVASKQDITEVQALFFCLFVERSVSFRQTDLSDISDMLGCGAINLLKYQNDFDELTERFFIRRKLEFDRRVSYYVPKEVLKALTQDIRYERESYKCEDDLQFFNKFYELTHLSHEDELSYKMLYAEIKRLFSDNSNLRYVKALKRHKLDFTNEILLTHFCRHLALNDDDVLAVENLAFLLEYEPQRRDLGYKLSKGKHMLMMKKFIEFDFNDGFEDREHYRLTDFARKKLLKGFKLKVSKRCSSDVIMCKNIEEKQLFYDSNIIRQIEELSGLLEEQNFLDIRNRMKEQKMRCGFACIFYGLPGTGKTETALQLARRTGRNIMQVNISEIKSMWVGESEKNIKAIFDRYREHVKNSKVAPILLFNEADAVIGKRKEGAERAVDKMENSIQNIILQEMETLDGIMIATTNLEQNMDKAFERRFLYKIKFNKPSVEARTSIWRSMIPTLSDGESKILASKYDFSGGQIENIARHYAIDNVLHGECENRLERLCAYSEGEKFEKKECHKIGFV